MNRILIINLKRHGDLYSTAHLIGSLIADNPESKIDLLIYDEFKKSSQTLRQINTVHTINRNEILTLKKNNIFSDGIALDKFHQSIAPLREQEWDRVINYSNDHVSSYLTSYLSNHLPDCLHSGIKYLSGNVSYPSNDWAIVFNDVLTSFKHTPIHFMDCYHQMCGIKKSTCGSRIITSEKYDRSAMVNINKLRKQRAGKNNIDIKIIGIQLKSSTLEKDIDFDTLIKLIGEIIDDPSRYPILLVAPDKHERLFANKINEQFENKLVTIEADFIALPSILMNIDVLVTPDTSVKHLADLMDTPIVEVSLGKAPFLKQGTIGTGNIILSLPLSQRSWISNSTAETIISAQDIITAIDQLLGQTKKNNGITSAVTMYRVAEDNLGTTYIPFGNTFDVTCEMSRMMTRQYLMKYFNIETNDSIYDLMTAWPKDKTKNWIRNEKENITETMKDLLSTLRLLLLARNNVKKGQLFVNSLDKLLARCHHDFISSVPILIFRSKLEILNDITHDGNRKSMEQLLFELKGNIQKSLACVRELENRIMKNKIKQPAKEI